jgi:hypothetical protein
MDEIGDVMSKALNVICALGIVFSVGCSSDLPDAQRRLAKTQESLSCSSEEMEEYVRAKLDELSGASLQEPMLIMARVNVPGSGGFESNLENALEIETIVYWAEAQPTVDAVKFRSFNHDQECVVRFTRAQQDFLRQEAKKTVLFGLSLRLDTAWSDGAKLQSMLSDGGAEAVLMRSGREVAEPLELKSPGEFWPTKTPPTAPGEKKRYCVPEKVCPRKGLSDAVHVGGRDDDVRGGAVWKKLPSGGTPAGGHSCPAGGTSPPSCRSRLRKGRYCLVSWSTGNPIPERGGRGVKLPRKSLAGTRWTRENRGSGSCPRSTKD